MIFPDDEASAEARVSERFFSPPSAAASVPPSTPPALQAPFLCRTVTTAQASNALAHSSTHSASPAYASDFAASPSPDLPDSPSLRTYTGNISSAQPARPETTAPAAAAYATMRYNVHALHGIHTNCEETLDRYPTIVCDVSVSNDSIYI